MLKDNSSLNYAQLQHMVSNCAQQLRTLGVEPGSRVGIYLPKHILSAVAPFAISTLGAVFVPINPLLTDSQVKHIASDCDISLMITSYDRAKRLHKELQNLGMTYLFSETSNENEHAEIAGEVWSSDKQSAGGSSAAQVVKSAPNETLAALLYTSGSTGLPKGVMVSHQNLTLGAKSVNEYLGLTESDRLLALLPFSFDYGLNQLISSVLAGATCVLFDYLFPKDVMKAVSTRNITGIAGVPALWAQLVNGESANTICDQVRYFTNSGGHLPEAILKKLRTQFPSAKPFLMYGLTEAFRSTYLPPSEITTRPESIGIPIPNATLFVVKENGSIAEPGEQGELVHAGPLVTMGYWNRPNETAKIFRPEPNVPTKQKEQSISLAVWSGDTVRIDEGGFLYFVGRRDAMIKTSGYRVSPEEIEEVLYELEQVNSAAAVGIPDDALGEAIMICVELKACAKHQDIEQIQREVKRHCRENLPSYLVPQKILICDALPKNPNGKIDRGMLSRTHRVTK